MNMRSPKKRDLEIKQIGTLSVPFSQGRFAQHLLWLKNPSDGECPLDLSILPDAPPGPDVLADGDQFFVFREICVEEDEDRNEIVFVYDRMRVESGGVKHDGSLNPHLTDFSNEEGNFIDQVARQIYNKYQIVLSKDLLKRLRDENPALRESEDVASFMETLRDLGMFSNSYAEQLSPEVHLGINTESDNE